MVFDKVMQFIENKVYKINNDYISVSNKKLISKILKGIVFIIIISIIIYFIYKFAAKPITKFIIKRKEIYKFNQTNEFVDYPYLMDSTITGIVEVLKGIALFVTPILFLIKWWSGNHKIKYKNVKDIQKAANDKKMLDTIITVIQGIITIGLGFKILLFYTPNNTQISLALLIQYLKKKEILGKPFYKILKKFRPRNIGKVVDPTQFKAMLDDQIKKEKLNTESTAINIESTPINTESTPINTESTAINTESSELNTESKSK